MILGETTSISYFASFPSATNKQLFFTKHMFTDGLCLENGVYLDTDQTIPLRGIN